MSSTSGEFEPVDAPMTPQLPEDGIETAKKVLNIDLDTVERCIGCPLVEQCLENAEGRDPNSAAAYIRYALQIQDNCSGPVEEKSKIPFVKSRSICGSPAVRGLSARNRRVL